MNFKITQDNGLVVNVSYSGYTIHISFCTSEHSVNIAFPRQAKFINCFNKVFTNVLGNDNGRNEIVDIEGVIFNMVVYVNRIYVEPSYLFKINNFNFSMSQETFFKLNYFFDNIRQLSKEELNQDNFEF